MNVNLKHLSGQRVKTAIIVEWLKEEGDFVKKGDLIARVETFKITADIYAPCNGVLSKILYKQYEYAGIEDDIAVIDEDIAVIA